MVASKDTGRPCFHGCQQCVVHAIQPQSYMQATLCVTKEITRGSSRRHANAGNALGLIWHQVHSTVIQDRQRLRMYLHNHVQPCYLKCQELNWGFCRAKSDVLRH
uniref:Uncharacterized protein n=1 Tax=Sphaerodactylus townsendi TaxID=933632 RepID=A0ACB8E5F7_9SAUR